MDAESGNGLANVTLSLKNPAESVFTDERGSYSWTPKVESMNDSVYIRCVGYYTIGRLMRELKNATLMLSPQNYSLQEITVKRKRPKTRLINGFNVRLYGERDRIPEFMERQTDWIGRPFIGYGKDGKYSHIRSVKVLQEAFQTKDLSLYRGQQKWRFRLRILEADPFGRPTDHDLLEDRVIITVSDVDYRIFDRVHYDPKTNSTSYTNWDFTEKIYYGFIDINLLKYEVDYPKNGVFIFIEMLPPLILGGDRLFKLAKLNVGNVGWYLNGRSKQWSRGVHWVTMPDGKTVEQNIEPAIALELIE